MMNRREFIKTGIAGIAALSLAPLGGCAGGNGEQPANPEIKVIKSGSGVYIRTTWDGTNDLVQKMEFVDSRNNIVNFSESYILPKNTADKDIPAVFCSGTLVAWQADDACPAFYNGAIVGGNHGAEVVKVVESTGHGKLQAEDLGSEWLDSSSRKWYLLKVVDADHLWFMSEDIGSSGIWQFAHEIAPGPLTHSNGATHTAGIAVTSQTTCQLTGALQGQVKRLLINGVEITADGVYACNTVDIVNSYNIPDLAGVIGYYKTLSGTNRKATFADDVIASDCRFEITYRFAANGSCTVYHQFRTFQELALNYVGFVQSYRLEHTNKRLRQYVPKTTAVAATLKTWNFNNQEDITDQIEGINFTAETWADADNLPDRAAMIVKDNGGKAQVGYVAGYSPLSGIGVASVRKTMVGNALNLYNSRKNYLHGIDSGGSAFPGGRIAAGTVIDAVAYRSIYNPLTLPQATVFTWFQDGTDVVVLLDFHQPVTRLPIPLPAGFAGKTVNVVDKSPSFSLIDGANVLAERLSVTVTGEYGYAVLKIA